ncbi:type II toxin-antitoxin system VapC family toxin [Thiocapsa rosea]|uniref:PIN domain nuclease of toxin-antitoxin system n=1 Tax=Thiocapsa rosea TaxID=69360 RepID=A0A495VA59_9GAMM|nr:type II toxin-antitoxin system VapC family toxin [Thiocapsa rosea]RKT46174.1 PIN domain nuclease of toxin-antitoxin system [Thiocapsa rosea]
MRLLLDTHTLLWWVDDDPRLSPEARRLIGDEENACHVSLVSAWEMAIKSAIGKLRLAVPVQRYFQEHLPANDFQLLPIDLGHVTLVETLPLRHRDPFDRLLMAQAQHGGLTLVSIDSAFDAYGVTRIW